MRPGPTSCSKRRRGTRVDCAAVAQLGLNSAADVPVTIQSAAIVTAGAPAPCCAVQGTVVPANTFVMRLPTQG